MGLPPLINCFARSGASPLPYTMGTLVRRYSVFRNGVFNRMENIDAGRWPFTLSLRRHYPDQVIRV